MRTRARTPRDVHRTVDDRPYGGGPGHGSEARADVEGDRCRGGAATGRVATHVYVSAGRAVHAGAGEEFSTLPGMTLVAGRYEGLDERVIESRIDREVSVGDYVLSGVSSPRS